MKQAHSTDAYISKEDREFLKQYFKEIEDYKPLSAEEEAKVAQKIHDGDRGALQQLINANLKFVITVAKQYQHRGLDLPDLINEGNIGLITAAKKFDETQGCKFISYAVWWIRESILQALAKSGRTIRLPMGQVDLLGKINKTISDFELKNGRRPSENEIAEILDVIDKTVSTVIEASGRIESLDAPVSTEDDDFSVIDTYQDPNAINPEKKIFDESVVAEFKKMLSILPPIEQYIIGHLYGVGYDEMTIDEIAVKLNKTKKRIQQVKEKGIRHLRERTTNKALKKILETM